MEFDLHIITNGNRANISFDYSNQNEIDTQQLKDAVNKNPLANFEKDE
jgi:hypothetical protein